MTMITTSNVIRPTCPEKVLSCSFVVLLPVFPTNHATNKPPMTVTAPRKSAVIPRSIPKFVHPLSYNCQCATTPAIVACKSLLILPSCHIGFYCPVHRYTVSVPKLLDCDVLKPNHVADNKSFLFVCKWFCFCRQPSSSSMRN